ncbi:hypothetical protein QE374_001179 [Microbacterium sp. SORGH_AS428]|uniref:hypothetical protein n=1 Tax=Microbacterium sp. SORGH_AS_0428 TaxID=3041788 RepID=UPI00285772E8|nr:hypothetical protein [Microbacterium sp. SORGH_AS_0428]MDR6199270.1 hypothetical protein [Microbacterium sp. SORGH_AS_0428]
MARTDLDPAPDDASDDSALTRELLGEDAAARVTDTEDAASPGGRFAALRGWGRVFRGNRPLWITSAIAVASLVIGLLVGTFVVSPVEAASRADAPEPGLITVPVEFGELSNDVTIRADVGYADAVEVTIDTATLSGPAVVTGQVPEVGAELNSLSIALEVAGRPVIVLPGDLPAYRSLRFGVSGPDVVQLKNALRSVGIDGGEPASNVFDAQTAAGITALYAAVGYPAPSGDEGAAQAVSAAEAGVRSAQQAVAAARSDLDKARSGADVVTVKSADNAVAAAQRAVDDAIAANRPASEIADLQDTLALRQLERQQLDAPADTSAQRAAVDAANAQVQQAQQDLQRAREGSMAFLPSSEVLYLTGLPRRVDAVNVARGAVLQGAAMTVSGATVRLTGSAGEADAALLQVGGEASFDLPDGTPHRAVITALAPSTSKDSTGRWSIELEPDPLTPEQIQQMQGSNVRVAIPVGATEGEVLSVPVAALTAGPGGEARVEVVEGDPRDPDAKTRLVTVKTGLAASGAVEITPLEGAVDEGDLVVVGR